MTKNFCDICGNEMAAKEGWTVRFEQLATGGARNSVMSCESCFDEKLRPHLIPNEVPPPVFKDQVKR